LIVGEVFLHPRLFLSHCYLIFLVCIIGLINFNPTLFLGEILNRYGIGILEMRKWLHSQSASLYFAGWKKKKRDGFDIPVSWFNVWGLRLLALNLMGTFYRFRSAKNILLPHLPFVLIDLNSALLVPSLERLHLCLMFFLFRWILPYVYPLCWLNWTVLC